MAGPAANSDGSFGVTMNVNVCPASSGMIGAGGGGFLMFYTEEKTRLRAALAQTSLREVRMRFDLEGSQVTARS